MEPNEMAMLEDEEQPSSAPGPDPLLEERRALLRAQCEYWSARAHQTREYWSARAHQTRLECLALERRLGLPPSVHTVSLAFPLGLTATGGGSATDAPLDLEAVAWNS